MNHITREERNEAIRRLRCHGETLDSIGDLFNISRQRVDQIIQRQKENTRKRTKKLIDAGELKRPDSCEKCGSEEDLEAHHHDYNDAEDVEFLCEQCHTEIHGDGKRRRGARLGRVEDVDPDTIGGRVRIRRVELRMTQGELAEQADTSAPYISNLENSTITPLVGTVGKLAKALRCSTDWLIFGDSEIST